MIVGDPGSSPVSLSRGAGIQFPPLPTAHGKIFLTLPVLNSWILSDIPANGVYDEKVNVPAAWSSGEMYPYQALLGNWGDPDAVLTNLLKVEVE